MAKMRVAQFVAGKGPSKIVERERPEPGEGFVRVKVQASGICHSDSLEAPRNLRRDSGRRAGER
jgi:propanol-preferring alcohol dehydrogenase